MQILTGKSIPRRTFLRGLGATVALPYLDAMEPAFSAFGKAAARRRAEQDAPRLHRVGARRRGLQHVGRDEVSLGAGEGRPRTSSSSPRARCRRSSRGGSI